MFEQIYIKISERPPVPPPLAPAPLDPLAGSDRVNGIHLIVLVHGFQGNSYDMRVMKNNISLLHPEALFLCSSKNEGKTEDDIREMGTRLAQEVIDYAQEWCPGSTLGMISFIGHSLGGVIIRAALPYLKKFQDKMENFITFSSPHLGYMYASNTIVNAGMWVLKRWRKSKCLEQLTMSDAANPKETFLCQLSAYEGMSWFKNVLLVSSYQDRYVPVESARVELMQKAIDDEKRGAVYIEIIKNILSAIKAERLYRIDMDFMIAERYHLLATLCFIVAWTRS